MGRAATPDISTHYIRYDILCVHIVCVDEQVQVHATLTSTGVISSISVLDHPGSATTQFSDSDETTYLQ